jgi:hypothetical protein
MIAHSGEASVALLKICPYKIEATAISPSATYYDREIAAAYERIGKGTETHIPRG